MLNVNGHRFHKTRTYGKTPFNITARDFRSFQNAASNIPSEPSFPGEHMDIISLLKAERDKVARQLNSLNAALAAFTGTYTSTTRPRRKMSAASRRKIAAAQRARWAKQKNQKVIPIKTAKRRISPEGLAHIRAAAKKRWAKEKQKKAA
jgi:hypothetical protein